MSQTDSLQIAEKYFEQSVDYWKKWDYKQAFFYAEKSLKIRQKLIQEGQNISLSHNFNILGAVLFRMGQNHQALQYFKKALAEFDKNKEQNIAAIANCQLNIGAVYMEWEAYTKGIIHHQKALNTYLQLYGQDSLQAAMAYNNLGACYSGKGEYQTAINYYLQSLDIRLEKLGEKHPSVLQLYGNLGQSLKEIGEYTKAIDHQQKSLHLALEVLGEEHPSIFWYYKNLGTTHAENGDKQTALQYLQKALSLSQKSNGKLHYHTAESHLRIGRYLYNQGKYSAAIEHFKKAYQSNIPELPPMDYWTNAPYQNALSTAWLQETLHCEALAYFQLFRENPLCISELIYALNNCRIALLLYHQVRQSYLGEGSKLRLAQRTFPICELGIEIALTAVKIMETRKQDFLRASQKMSNSNARFYTPKQLSPIQNQQGCRELAFEFCEQAKGILLLSNQKEIAAKSVAGIPKDLLEKEQNLKIIRTELTQKINQEQVKATYEKDETQIRNWQDEYFEYEQEYQQLIQQLETDYPQYYQLKHQVKTTTIQSLQSKLPFNTALVEYFIGEKNLYTFLITSNDAQFLQSEKPADFEELIEAFKTSIDEIDKSEYTELAFELYEILLKPIQLTNPLITSHQSPITNLKIIPSGILSTIPFEALLTEEVTANAKYADLPYLLLQYDISYHYSTTLWSQTVERVSTRSEKSKQIEASFIGFAPVYKSENKQNEELQEATTISIYNQETTRSIQIGAETYSELIYSEQEVSTIASYFNDQKIPTQTFLHAQANTSNFLQNIGKHKYVLISAHGFYNEQQPDLTGIILSPDDVVDMVSASFSNVAEPMETRNSPSSNFPLWRGQGGGLGDVSSENIFYLSDTYNLELNADLVVLSCCETGVGKLAKGEGIMALNRGFFYAGAKNVIYTLFKVYDQASCQLTQHLFQHILKSKPYASALKEAKRRLILQGKAPIHWAGYLLIGE